MLEVVIPSQNFEFYDEKTDEFSYVNIKETKLQLEHSLISIKKWEQKYHKPFLGSKDKNYQELSYYVKCMTLNHGVDPDIYFWIPDKVMNEIVDYIHDPMTATTFRDDGLIGAQTNSRSFVTAEIIYYWMIALQIPVEFQKWHLNSLLTLIKVVNIKSDPKKKKVDKRAAARERAILNAKRRAELGSKG